MHRFVTLSNIFVTNSTPTFLLQSVTPAILFKCVVTSLIIYSDSFDTLEKHHNEITCKPVRPHSEPTITVNGQRVQMVDSPTWEALSLQYNSST